VISTIVWQLGNGRSSLARREAPAPGERNDSATVREDLLTLFRNCHPTTRADPAGTRFRDRDGLGPPAGRGITAGWRPRHGVRPPGRERRRYEQGEIVFENRKGQRIFNDVNINGEQAMASFDEREARAFVAHLKRYLPK
jgi:hypothetical protein